MKINNTPVRTSRNYEMNNVLIEDINVDEKLKEFKNLDVICDSSKIDVSVAYNDENNETDYSLTYGISKYHEAQIIKNSNKNIKIKIDSKTPKNVRIDFNFDQKNKKLVDDIEIVASKNSRANIILKYESIEDVKCYHNLRLRGNILEGANITVTIINLLSLKSDNFVSIENTLNEGSKLKYTVVDFGAKNSISNIYNNLAEDYAQSTLNTIYLGVDSQLFDINYIDHLKGKNTDAKINVEGALKDKAIKKCKATIDFKKGSKGAKGDESDSCMLMSDDARSMSLPILLCTEEDVDGAHSASSGKVDPKELFYIMSRGFDKKDAMKLLVRAKFNSIIDSILDESVKDKVILELDKKLD